MAELGKRVVTGVILLFLAVVWFFYTPEPWFAWILGVLAMTASIELLLMLKLPRARLFALFMAIVWAMLIGGAGFVDVLLAVMIGWTSLFVITTKTDHVRDHFARLAAAQWMVIWLLLFVSAVQMLHDRHDGIVLLAGAFAGVWVADIAAYFAGRHFGTRKLCPAVSPGKTIQGFAAALVAGTVVSAIIWVGFLSLDVGLALLLGVVLVLTAVLGDLAESALKRAAGVKDSSALLPGHGGLLDRIDALLPSIPAVSALWLTLV
ncbi:MAG: phosphatidate cytidylyltransferase [Mariprofundaceae bacterium]|nr:phosphatidate cytidylyltransferase [Mariprofundaceae bacterium]